jgi:DHA2 family multidrug resistance protein
MRASPADGDGSLIEVGLRRALLTLTVISASLLELIDTTVVNVALPTIQGNLGADFSEGTWIITSYVVANAIVIPINPWLQRRFGRRNYYTASIVAFTASSLLCGLATSLEQLVAFRVLQGLAGGGLLATGQAILADIYPRDKQGQAQGFFSIGVIMGPALGPLIGGWLTDNASWRWAFFINLPIGIVAALLSAALMRDTRRSIVPVDVAGAGLLVAGLGSLQLFLDRGQLKDWFADDGITASAVVAVVALIAFVVWELRAQHPIVNLRALAVREVWLGTLLSTGVGFVLFGIVILVPQFVQSQLGFTATESGLLFLIQAGASFVATPLSIVLFRRGWIQPRFQVAGGFVLFALSAWMLIHVESTTADFDAFVPPLLLSGLGISQLFVPITLSTLGRLPRSLTTVASAYQNLARQLGGSVATAIVATVQQRVTTARYVDIASELRLDRPEVARYVATAPHALAQLVQFAITQAAVLGFIAAAVVAGGVALCIAPFAFLLHRVDASATAVADH